MAVLLAFSFLAGLATILAPCIWPLLPIVLSASSAGGRRRPFGIVLGLMAGFFFSTLFVSYLERALGLDPDSFRWLAVAVLLALGVVMALPPLAAGLEGWVSRLVGPLAGRLRSEGEGLAGGLVAGLAMGLVWAPCAGPILAAVATLAAAQAVDLRVAAVAAAYVLGLGVPLFAVATAGSRLFDRLRGVSRHAGRIQQACGLVLVAAAALIASGYDRVLETRALDVLPDFSARLSSLERSRRVGERLAALRGELAASAAAPPESLADLGPAPELEGLEGWLNSPPLSMARLRGKVVLVDFWTYSCINCLRTLPHLARWQELYGQDGLVIIGVHTPEFAFEKKRSNVARAVESLGIRYPVAQDNGYRTWRAFDNEFWPAEYLIDARGRIRLEHFGEGRYDEMEAAVRTLLAEAGRPVAARAAAAADLTPTVRQTPETYVGLARQERFSSPEKVTGGEQRFTLPDALPQDRFALQGAWDVSSESAASRAGSALELRFRAGKVFLVLGPARKGDSVGVLLDGRPVGPDAAGADVRDGRASLDGERLYGLVDLRGKAGPHLLRLEFRQAGTAVYAFTFG